MKKTTTYNDVYNDVNVYNDMTVYNDVNVYNDMTVYNDVNVYNDNDRVSEQQFHGYL